MVIRQDVAEIAAASQKISGLPKTGRTQILRDPDWKWPSVWELTLAEDLQKKSVVCGSKLEIALSRIGL